MKNTISGFFLLFCIPMVWSACNTVENSDDSGNTYDNLDSGWEIPVGQVYMGAAKDQIESIDRPSFVSPEDIQFMLPEDLIVGVKFGDQIKGYPHKVLNYHEIVNDNFDKIPYALTFCPLTGSALGWHRKVTQYDTTTFGVSGRIYKNNLIAYDRATDSFWSQMLVLSVFGELRGTRPWEVYHNMVEMNWASWKKYYPEAEVLTGTPRLRHAYDEYPYGKDYPNDNQNIVFPIENEDDRLSRKTLAHGLYYNSGLIVFPITLFEDSLRVINYSSGNRYAVVIGESDRSFMKSYERLYKDEVLEFQTTEAEFPAVMKDQHGTIWNVFGEAIEGPGSGDKLEPVLSYNAYWFAWADFYPDARIYGYDY